MKLRLYKQKGQKRHLGQKNGGSLKEPRLYERIGQSKNLGCINRKVKKDT